MQADATARAGHKPVHSPADHLGTPYQKVVDGRKRPIRGLWQRNGRFYARLSIEDIQTGRKTVRRVPLVGVSTVAEATAALRKLETQRAESNLPVIRRTPKFEDYAKQYLAYYETVKDAKRPKTLQTERTHISHWIAHLGQTRLDRITPAAINAFIAKRQGAGKHARTVNLGVTMLRNVLKRAIADGYLRRLPMENLRPLKVATRKRRLYTLEEIEKVCAAGMEASKNGLQLVDYLRVMAFSGARMSETLRIKWADVDWGRRQLHVGADGLAKNHEARVVDFNARLEAVLREMSQRIAPDSDWLFPSPQRGDVDRAARSFRESLLLARKQAGVEGFGFHDCRHFFVSYCVMSGIDYMTIARWAGHKDGGILIGKVYGHLSNEHTQRQAERLNFGPVILAGPQTESTHG